MQLGSTSRMSESKIWLSPKDRILYALYKERNGLGFNELVQKYELHGKYVKVFADCKKGKLFKDGYIECKKVTGKGGVKDVRMITGKGVEYVEKNIVGLEVGARNVLMLAQARTEKEKFECLGLVFKDIYKYASARFMSGKRLDMIGVLFDVLSMAIMNDINEFWLSKKDDMLKHNVYDGEYVFPEFTRNNTRPLGFIVQDAKSAWEKCHYLNTHHRYVLEQLGIYSKEEIENKNKEWLEKHGKYDVTVVKTEIRDRLEEFDIQIETLQPVQKNGKIVMQNGKEYDIKEPPETYIQTPDWMRHIPQDYGNSLWDIR